MLKQQQTLLNKTLQEAYIDLQYLKKARMILRQLQSNALKNGKKIEAQTYEKQKDLWAELYHRVKREIYLIKNTIATNLNIQLNIIKPTNNKDIQIKLTMDQYAKLLTKVNKRVFKLKETLLNMLNNIQYENIFPLLYKGIHLFDKEVIKCVTDNIHHFYIFVGMKSNKTLLHNKIKNIKKSTSRVLDVYTKYTNRNN